MFDFSNFKSVGTANEKVGNRTPQGQKFEFKFKKFESKKGAKDGKAPTIESNFVISNTKFDELGLADNGLMQIISPEGKTYLAVVGNEDAVMMRRTGKLADDAEKGKKFKSTIVENALHAQGVIDKDAVGVNQNLTLIKVADATTIGSKQIPASSVWEVAKGEVSVAPVAGETSTEDDDDDDSVQNDASESLGSVAVDEDDF